MFSKATSCTLFAALFSLALALTPPSLVVEDPKKSPVTGHHFTVHYLNASEPFDLVLERPTSEQQVTLASNVNPNATSIKVLIPCVSPLDQWAFQGVSQHDFDSTNSFDLIDGAKCSD